MPAGFHCRRRTRDDESCSKGRISRMSSRRLIRAGAAARLSSSSGGAALALICLLNAGTSHAQTAATAGAGTKTDRESAADAKEAAEEEQDEILVTAHRQKGAVATDIKPETTLNSTAIRALGAADLDEVFEAIAPEIKNGQSDAGSKAAAASIVLVNGQRIAGFNSIKDLPPEAIRRIEIFPEKVALQYGYPPDQRVVNVVLRGHYHAISLLARDTLAPENWRGIYRAKTDIVRIGEKSHWNIDLDYRHEDAIFDKDTLPDPSAPPGSNAPPHTLATQEDRLSMSGAATRIFGKMSAELTGRLDLSALQSRPGLSSDDGELLTQQGQAGMINGPLDRTDRTVGGQTTLTLNGMLSSWHWSFIGKLDAATREIRTGDAAGDDDFAAILLPPPALFGLRCHSGMVVDCVSTSSRDAIGDLYLNGDLFALPAGPVTAALRTGFAFSGIRSHSQLDQPAAASRARSEGSAQANLDFPITPAHSPVGKLSVGINGQARQTSDFGTLSTLGSTLEWSPAEHTQILASFSREQQAPSLMQLGQATLVTPDLREFDFTNDDTSIVRRFEGGNGALRRGRSRVANFRIQISPFRTTKLAISADYTIERSRNPIASVSAATPANTAAFPDHFVRSIAGTLTAIDLSPVNLARRDRQQLRWGINYTTPFGRPHPAKPNADGTPKPPVRNSWQVALYHSWRFQDDVLLRNGLPRLNLLDGDIISDKGGTPRHELELQTTLSTRAWSAAINAAWQSPTKASAGPLAEDHLTFSQGITFNLRLQINLAEQHWLMHMLPFLHGSLNLSVDNLFGAHTSVHDSSGKTPLPYTESYLNPTGRTFRITLRKRFH
jgi:hypothetical protein